MRTWMYASLRKIATLKFQSWLDHTSQPSTDDCTVSHLFKVRLVKKLIVKTTSMSKGMVEKI